MFYSKVFRQVFACFLNYKDVLKSIHKTTLAFFYPSSCVTTQKKKLYLTVVCTLV